MAAIALTRLAGLLVGQTIVAGMVRDESTDAPISGAEVVIESLSRRAVTDAEGRFAFIGLPGGSRRILVRAVGYAPFRSEVSVVNSATVRLDVRLVPIPVRLAPVEVEGRTPRPKGIGFEGFEERRRLGFGRFVDSSVLRTSEQHDLITVMRRAGVEVRNRRAVGRRGCPMAVYLDGVLIRDPPSLEGFTVSSLAGVEAYSGVAQIPGEYGALDQVCGVLLLWTVRGR